MGERKVLNKYYPPDFDHRLIPKGKKKKNAQIEVRMMLPFSIQCLTCGSFMYRGTKFNSQKELVVGRDYLGIQIFRFYGKCSTCGAQFSICTDPEKTDYSVEHGVKRLFESWKMAREDEAQADEAIEAAGQADSMSRLEFMARDSMNQQDELDALDDIRAQNARHERPADPLTLIDALHSRDDATVSAATAAEIAVAEDEAELAAVEFKSAPKRRRVGTSGGVVVHRLADSDSDDGGSGGAAAAAVVAAAPAAAKAKAKVKARPRFTVRKRVAAGGAAAATASGAPAEPAAKKARPAAAAPAPPPQSTGLLGIGGYSSSSSDDE